MQVITNVVTTFKKLKTTKKDQQLLITFPKYLQATFHDFFTGGILPEMKSKQSSCITNRTILVDGKSLSKTG